MGAVIRFELKAFGIERSISLGLADKPVSHYVIDIDSGIVKVVYVNDSATSEVVRNVDEPKAMTGVVMPEDKESESESASEEVNEATEKKTEAGVAKEAETAGEPVSEEAAKADAHQAGDSGASGGTVGTMSATGKANEPNVVISGGTPTVDGKKPTTRGRRATGK